MKYRKINLSAASGRGIKNVIKNVIIALVSVAFLGLTTGCDSEKTSSSETAEQKTDQTTMKDVKHEVVDAAKAIKEYSFDQRDQAVKKVKSTLDDLDSRIDKLQDRIDDNWDKMNKATRQKTKATLRALRKQRNEVAEWYGGLKHSSADAWEDMKKGFSDAYTSFADAWKKAEKEFDSEK